MSAAQDEVDKLFASKDHRTTHPEDDARSDSDRSTGSDRENRSPAASPSAAEIRDGPATIPYRKAHGNTGPKGVIRDAQSYRSAQLKAASTVELSLDQVSIRDSGLGVQPATNSGLLRPGSSRRSDDGDEDEEFGDDDGSFMEQWRRSRLRQLQTSTTKGTPSPAVVPVDGDGYLDAVDRSGASTVVVVYIYDESVSSAFFAPVAVSLPTTMSKIKKLTRLSCSRAV